jgi:hypothetical protein
VLAVFGLEPREGFDADPDAVGALAAWKSARKSKVAENFDNCRIEWLEWGGTRSHPTAKVRVDFGASVSISGQTAKITLSGGDSLVKRLATKGFSYSTKFSDAEFLAWKDFKRKELERLKNAAIQDGAEADAKRSQDMEWKKWQDQKTKIKRLLKKCIKNNAHLAFDFEPGPPKQGSPECSRFGAWLKCAYPAVSELDEGSVGSFYQSFKQRWINEGSPIPCCAHDAEREKISNIYSEPNDQ